MPILEERQCTDADELHLAQLACTKLTKLLQGTLSVGLPALVTGVPEPGSFFAITFQRLFAFTTVLCTISGQPSASDAILRLQKLAEDLLTCLQQLQAEITSIDLLVSHDLSDELLQAKTSARVACDLLEALSRHLGLDPSLIANIRALSMQMFDSLPSLSASYQNDPTQISARESPAPHA